MSSEGRTPRELLEEAIHELESEDPHAKARACDKGWQAATMVMGPFLAGLGIKLPPYSPQVYREYSDALGELAMRDPALEKLDMDWCAAAQSLPVACFCHRDDTRACKRILERNVRGILEVTGNWL